MSVLIACEESQIVTNAFRNLGLEAFSCDVEETSGENPEWHLKMDAFEAAKLKPWKMMIGFPPCTYLSSAGLHFCNIEKHGQKAIDRIKKRNKAIEFFFGFVQFTDRTYLPGKSDRSYFRKYFETYTNNPSVLFWRPRNEKNGFVAKEFTNIEV